MKILFYFTLVLQVTVLINCAGMKSNNQPSGSGQITKIVYDFGDASVPPPYHRSYTITLTGDSISKHVHSYSETISNVSKPVTNEQFASVVKIIDDCKFTNGKEKENTACTGGVSETVSIYSQDERVYYGSVYHCGGDDYGNLLGDTKLLLAELNKLISDDLINNE
jgi:hypothetical protein